jgi:hypothetical protein
MARRDRDLLVVLREELGFGSIADRKQRNHRWQPISTLSVTSRKAHVAATIPFMETHLLAPTQKRREFELWRDALVSYDSMSPRKVGRSTCSETGCDRVVRGRGLCRPHYYRATGF